MQTNRLKALRILLIIILVLLGLQYELGMIVNMSNPAAIPPFPFSRPAVDDALHSVGPAAMVHAETGVLLMLLSLIIMIVSLLSHRRGAQVFGVLGLLSILFAAYGGLSFVLSGFQNDGSSHNMATNMLLSFTLYFLELYVLKG